MNYSFAADRTLGKLAKWLRLLGFDTVFESGCTGKRFYENLEPERVLLTRIGNLRQQLKESHLIFIKANDLTGQLHQTIGELAITINDINPFSRCIECNSAIIEIDKENVFGLVPDYIWENHNNFSMCRNCERFFWTGSHVNRARERINQLFEQNCFR
jgi:uncharacterized protein with PIN domain